MSRRKPNLIALGSAVAYLLCFIFLPFYHIALVSFNGWILMQHYIIMCLPLVVSILMMLASVLMDVRISICIGTASIVLDFVLLLVGRSILLTGNTLTGLLAAYITHNVGFDVTFILPITIGIGGIFNILLSVGFIVSESLTLTRKAPPPPVSDDRDWGQTY